MIGTKDCGKENHHHTEIFEEEYRDPENQNRTKLDEFIKTV